MVFAISFFSALFWFIFVALILYSKSSPEGQVRRRIMAMIENAESLRLQTINSPSKNISQNVDHNPRFFSQKTFFERVIRPLLNKFSEEVQGFAPVQVKSLFENLIFHLERKASCLYVAYFYLLWIGIRSPHISSRLLSLSSRDHDSDRRRFFRRSLSFCSSSLYNTATKTPYSPTTSRISRSSLRQCSSRSFF